MASGICCTESWFGTMQSPAVLLCGQLFVGRPQGSAEELWVPLLSLLLRGAVVQHSTGTPQEPSRRCSQPGLWCCSVPCWATARSPQTAATSSASLPVVKGANQQVYCHALQAPEGESRLRVSNFAAIILIFVYCKLPNWGLRYEKFNVRCWKAFFTWKKAQNICNLLSLASGLLFCTFF